MLHFFQQVSLVQAATALVLTVAAVTAGYKVLQLARRTGHFLDDWFGEAARPGTPERPGVTARLAKIEDEQARVRREVEHNGGGSLKDAVRRVEQKQLAQEATLLTLTGLLGGFASKEQAARTAGHEASQAAWNAVEEIAANGQGEKG